MKKEKMSQSKAWLFALGACLLSAPAAAYVTGDAIKIAAPINQNIEMLIGYDSKTGKYKESCLQAVAGRSQGKSPDSDSVFRLANSMHDITRERNLAVNVALDLNFGIGAGSAEVDTRFEKKVRNKVEKTAAFAMFRDLGPTVYVEPTATFALNETGEQAYTAVAKGNFKKFKRTCGDSVLVGFQKGRVFKGVGSLARSESFSDAKRDIKTKLAARYMLHKMSASVELNEREIEQASKLNIEIDYSASGDALLDGATDIQQLKQVFRKFSKLPKKQTSTYQYVFYMPYSELLSQSALDFGLNRKEWRKLNTILDGVFAIQAAKFSVARMVRASKKGDKKKRLKATKARFSKELRHLSRTLRSNKGCIGRNSVACKNLGERFSSNKYPNANKRQQINAFVERSVNSSNDVCAVGYPISKPNGQSLCQRCPFAKQPVFLQGKNGACAYLAKPKAKQNVKRLWAKDLKTTKKVQQEAGVNTTVAQYPNYCNKANKKCGKATAAKICQAQGLGALVDHRVWRPGGLKVADNRPRTIYPDGSRCQAKPDDFEQVKCLSYQYIDCEKAS